MSKKQVYTVLELGDNEIKLLVCEFLEGRLNVLHKERQAVSGIANQVIVKQNDVTAAINALIAKTQANLNFSIDRVLLSIPSINFKNITKRVNVFIDSLDRKITIDHIKKGISDLLDGEDETYLPVNIGSVRYVTNGIISRKMPIGETVDVLVVSADVLYGDKDIVYSYIRCVEETGLEIMDICLDVFAAAEETSIVRKMDSKYVIGVRLESNTTTLTLFEKDKILSSQVITRGFNHFISRFLEQHRLKKETIFRLLKNNIPFDIQKCDDQKVFAYQNEDGEQVVLTKNSIVDLIEYEVLDWINYINEASSAIIESGETKFVLYGEGVDMDGMEDMLKKFKAPAIRYIPDILGARESAFTAMLGMFYVWNEQKTLKNDDRSCSNALQLEDTTSIKKRNDLGLTKRLKRALMRK